MIAIKGWEIPQKCVECPCFDRDYGCRAGIVSSCEKGRPKDCPLVEVVTCEDCKYNDGDTCVIDGFGVSDDYFCGNAKRREVEE